jgi:hypothetical protein
VQYEWLAFGGKSIKNLSSLSHEVISLQEEDSLLAIERLKEAKEVSSVKNQSDLN